MSQYTLGLLDEARTTHNRTIKTSSQRPQVMTDKDLQEWRDGYHEHRKAQLESREKKVQEKILELRAKGIIE